jgi:hypothetical protein
VQGGVRNEVPKYHDTTATVQGGVRNEVPKYRDTTATVQGGVRNEVPKYHDTTATVQGGVDNELTKSTLKEKGGEEEPLKYHVKDPTIKSHENGNINSSKKELEYDNVCIRYSVYLSEHINTGLTDRYMKLITIAREKTNET